MKKLLLPLLFLPLFASAQTTSKKPDSTYVKLVTLPLDDYLKLNGLANAYQAGVIWNPYMTDTKREQQNVIGYLVGLDKRVKVDSVKVAKIVAGGKP